MLRSLPRRPSVSLHQPADNLFFQGSDFEEWLGLALSGSRDAWISATDPATDPAQ
jgi:hypothetical protein